MERWRQCGPVPAARRRQAVQSFRPDLYRQGARLCGLNAPALDDKPAAAGPDFEMAGTLAPLRLSASRFFDAQ